jgi:hypothetical protein
MTDVRTKTLPETIDPFESLDGYTTEQLSTLNIALERELLAVMQDKAALDAMRESDKVKMMDAIGFLTRTGAEIMRRKALPSAGPRAICYESTVADSDPVRLSFTILAF